MDKAKFYNSLRTLIVIVWGVPFSLFAFIVLIFLPFNPHAMKFLAHLFGKVALFLCGIKLKVFNADRLESSRPCVFIANHQHNLDLILSAFIVPFKTVGIGKKSIKWLPIFGTAYWLAGNILIDRKNRASALASMREVEKSIKRKGINVWMMPEGTRSKGRGLLPFKKGAFHLAINGGVPLVPISFCQYETILRWDRWQAGTIFAQVGEPISTEGMNVATDSNSLREKSRDIIFQGIHKMDQTAKEFNMNRMSREDK